MSFDGKVFPVIGKAIAKYDFDARSEQELSLVAGQFVNIISKAGGDHGWWKGEYDRKVSFDYPCYMLSASSIPYGKSV